jgi:CO dehydrogenase maturation factor
VEHLGRATADAVDAMLIVVEPTARSLGTAEQIKGLAGDLRLTRLYLVGSKVQGEDDRDFIRLHSPALPVLGFLPVDPGVREADRSGAPVFDAAPLLAEAARDLAAALDRELQPA